MDANLRVKVFKYSSKEEMEKHIEEMKEQDWKCKRKGQYMFKSSSLVKDYLNDNNWEWSAEFYKQSVSRKLDKNSYYETNGYFFYTN